MSTVIKLNGHNQKKAKGKPVAAASATVGEQDNALRRALEKIVALNRDSTHHAFELGACFAEIKALVPERGFGRCLKVFTDYTVRSAWNYISIHERLGGYRDALLKHAILPTVMFELAKGEPAQIEAVIARMESGERIKVKDVREMLGTKPKRKSDTEVLNAGGPDGLRKVAEWKIDRDGVVTFECQTIGTPDEQQAGKTRKARRVKAGSRTAGAAPIRKVITHRLPIKEFQRGFETMQSGNSGKIVLEW